MQQQYLRQLVLLLGACATAGFVLAPAATARGSCRATPGFLPRSGVPAANVATNAEERARAAMESAEAADALSDSQAAGFSNIASGPATFPLAGVVGQEAIKTALVSR